MIDVSLDVLSKYIIQNNPTEVKNNLQRMRLADSNFEMSHDNFKSLLASLTQDPQYLTNVTSDALDVLVDPSQGGAAYLNALQHNASMNLGQMVRQVAGSTFFAAAQIVAANEPINAVAEPTTTNYSQYLIKKAPSFDTQLKLSPLGWTLAVLMVISFLGGLVSFVSFISKIVKNQ